MWPSRASKKRPSSDQFNSQEQIYDMSNFDSGKKYPSARRKATCRSTQTLELLNQEKKVDSIVQLSHAYPWFGRIPQNTGLIPCQLDTRFRTAHVESSMYSVFIIHSLATFVEFDC